ncbi:MAG: pyridoxamine 5'-phosphate oxidase family protein [Planctomycetaceae bacterium]|nr:pyridoxamine 5'-phosphate oxidase family protein [Planctomycetaceae bacterium]
MNFEQTDRNQVRRLPNRGAYDRETVFSILDAGCLCHVGFVTDNQPYVIPTLYGRDEDVVYLHGSAAGRMMKELASGIPVCLTVTHMDGLVLARSAFHHSVNYRSVVLFGTATQVSGEEKKRGLFVITEQVLKGRWDEVRPPNDKELTATSVLRMTIETASAKIRTGPPKDDAPDYALPIWAGVIPMQQMFGPAEPDSALPDGTDSPESVRQLMRAQG